MKPVLKPNMLNYYILDESSSTMKNEIKNIRNLDTFFHTSHFICSIISWHQNFNYDDTIVS